MKKLLSIIASLSVASVSASSLISCESVADTNASSIRLIGVQSIFKSILIETELDSGATVTKEIFEDTILKKLQTIISDIKSSDFKITYFDSDGKQTTTFPNLVIDDITTTVSFQISSNSSLVEGSTEVITTSVFSNPTD